jgi:5-(carboxyamino)imidazole ribonucleotide synthase
VATVEFENIPRATLQAVAARMPLHPSPQAIAICQNREREKNFLRENGIPCTDFHVVTSAAELADAACAISPARRAQNRGSFGYDGSGQIKLKATKTRRKSGRSSPHRAACWKHGCL